MSFRTKVVAIVVCIFGNGSLLLVIDQTGYNRTAHFASITRAGLEEAVDTWSGLEEAVDTWVRP